MTGRRVYIPKMIRWVAREGARIEPEMTDTMNTLEVPCPKCRAPIGVVCKKAPVGLVHTDRAFAMSIHAASKGA